MVESGIRADRSALLRGALNLTVLGQKGVWDGQVIMNDCELLRADWFASGPYQEWVAFVEDFKSIWTHRWGDHIIRTFGVAMHLEDIFAQKVLIPYAHQEVCLCCM